MEALVAGKGEFDDARWIKVGLPLLSTCDFSGLKELARKGEVGFEGLIASPRLVRRWVVGRCRYAWVCVCVYVCVALSNADVHELGLHSSKLMIDDKAQCQCRKKKAKSRAQVLRKA